MDTTATPSVGKKTTLQEYLSLTEKPSNAPPCEGYHWRDNFVSPLKVTSATSASSEANEKKLKWEKNLVLLPDYNLLFAKDDDGWKTATLPTKIDVGTAYAITRLMEDARIYNEADDVKTVVDWLTRGAMRNVLNLTRESRRFMQKESIMQRVNSGEPFKMSELDLNNWLDKKTFRYRPAGLFTDFTNFNLKMQWHH